MNVDVFSNVRLSCRPMMTSSSIQRFCRVLSRCLVLALLSVCAHRGAAQPFAVGFGGSVVNDTGTAFDIPGWGTYEGHLFAELALEDNVALQVRASRFGLPGTAVDAPNLEVDAGTLSVAYLFREEWFQAGCFAGGGVYRVAPNDLEAGQVPKDVRETVFGWHGGIVTIFAISPRIDARLEASGHLIRTDVGHKTILLGGSIAYHF
jgi:hypothetical protein